MINEKLICEMITNEKDYANSKYPLFHSMHEGNDVIREEINESKRELSRIKRLWKALCTEIRYNDEETACYIAGEMREVSILAIQELTQVAAMAEKFIDSIKAGEDDGIYAKK